MSVEMKILKTISFEELDKWFVSFYLNPYTIESIYPLVKLSEVIHPRKDRISKNDYKNDIPVIKKISFKDGKIHLRDTNETGMSLYRLSKNELLVSKINFHQGAISINNIGELVSSTHYQPYIINKNISKEYLTLCLRSDSSLNFIKYLRADGIKNEATYEFIGKLKIPLPPLSEQNRIVNNYNAKIKQANEQEQKAKQLKTSLQNIVDEFLGIKVASNNINKNNLLNFVSYKELHKWGVDAQLISKIIYFKDYPIFKISEISNVGSGGTPSRSRKDYYNGKIPWIKTGEVVNDIIYDTEEKITQEAIKNSSAKVYKKDSLIIAMYGQGKTRGRTAKLGVNATTNQACAVLYNIDSSKLLTDFLWIYLMNEYERLRELASGNNQPNLNAQMIKNYPVVIPSKEIQQNIINKVFSIKQQIKSLQSQSKANRENAIQEFEEEIFTKS